MTAENLIAFFKALPFEEQKKFMGKAEKIITPKVASTSKRRKKVLTEKEAMRYLVTTIFNSKKS